MDLRASRPHVEHRRASSNSVGWEAYSASLLGRHEMMKSVAEGHTLLSPAFLLATFRRIPSFNGLGPNRVDISAKSCLTWPI